MAQTVIDWSQSYATWVAGDGLALASFSIGSGTGNPHPWDWANLIASYIAADYDLTHRGAATSIKGRAANSSGVIADIAASTLGHVLRRDSTPALSFGTLLAGAFATGPGIVTLAMLDNGSARSLVGRSANSSGARADISGGGADTIAHDDGSTIAFRSISSVVSGIASRYVYRLPAAFTVTGTTSATSIFNGAITIPANTLSSNGQCLKIVIFGNHLRNQIGAWTFSSSLNGVTLFADTGTSHSSSALRFRWRMEIEIVRIDSTHGSASYVYTYSNQSANPTTGAGDFTNTGVPNVGGTVNGGVAGLDWTASQSFNLTVAPPANGNEWVTEGALVEAI